MLDFIRRGIKSWVAKIFLALLIVAMAVWGIGDIFTGGRGGTVANVGGTEVTADEFGRNVIRQQRLLTQQAGALITLGDLQTAGIDEQILAEMIRDAVYQEELNSLGIAVPAGAVRDTIASNPGFQDASGGFSQFAYQTTLGQQGFSPQEFEALTADLLGQQILTDAVSQGAAAAPGFARALTVFDGEQRRIATIRLPAADAPEPEAPTASQLTTYFEANAEDFRVPERRWGVYLRADPAALAVDAAPTDAEVRAEYDANPDTYTAEEARVVEQIVFDDAAAADDAARRIAAGETSFAEVAAEQNIAIGDLALGRVTPADLPIATADAVFGTTEPGVVGPVAGPFGTLLLNVTEVTIGGLQPFEAVADDIRARMAEFRGREAALDLVQRIDDQRAGGVPLEDIATALGMELGRFQGLDAAGNVPEDGQAPSVGADPRFLGEVQAAGIGSERDIIELSDGSYALILVNRIAESHIPELEAAREAVVQAWTAEQRLLTLEARAETLVGGTGGATDFGSISAAALQGITERAPFPRSNPPADISAALVEAIFTAQDGDIVIGRHADGNAVLLALVRGVIPLAEEDLAERVAALDEVLRGSIARDELEYFARALEERHGAFVNPDSIEAVFEHLGQTGGF